MKSPLEQALGDASEWKKQHASVASAANALLDAIVTDVEWQWANNDVTMHRLQSSMGRMQSAMSPFGRRLTTTDIKTLRKDFDVDEASLARELGNFVQEMKPIIEEVGQETKLLMAMHTARRTVAVPRQKAGT